MRFVPYAQRAEWADVVPVPQDDGPSPPAAIAYSDEYRSTLDTLRGLLAVGEVSARGFQLTAAVINLNPAHYTAWQYRRTCISKLLEAAPDLAAQVQLLKRDITFTSNIIITKGSKNYQLWYHRRWLVERAVASLAGPAPAAPADKAFEELPAETRELLEAELGVTSRILAGIGPLLVVQPLEGEGEEGKAATPTDDDEEDEEEEEDDDEVEEDAKNYHAWAHRQWVVATFGAGLGACAAAAPPGAGGTSSLRALHQVPELALTTRMLRADVRNNSVWSHRWFVLQQVQQRLSLPRASMPYWLASPEVDLALIALGRVTLNEAAWGYLRGILKVAAQACSSDFGGEASESAGSAWPGDPASGVAVLQEAAAGGAGGATASAAVPIAHRVLRLCAAVVGPAAATGHAEVEIAQPGGGSAWAAELLAEWYLAAAATGATGGDYPGPAPLVAAAVSLFSLAGRWDPVRGAYWQARAAQAQAQASSV